MSFCIEQEFSRLFIDDLADKGEAMLHQILHNHGHLHDQVRLLAWKNSASLMKFF